MSKYSDGRKYKVIGVCMAKYYLMGQTDFIKAFSQACAKRNYRIMVFSTLSEFYTSEYTDTAEEELFSLVDAKRFEALVVLSESFKSGNIPEKIVKKANDAGVPVFSIEKEIAGAINLRFDCGDAFERIVRHVVEEHGCRRVNFIAGMKGNSFSEERLKVYKDVLEENNIPISDERIGYGDFWEEPAAAALNDFFSSGYETPEAIICANDVMAIEICKRLSERGYKVPEDIIVTGFDGVEMERTHYPRLTTAARDYDVLCETISSVLGLIMQGKKVKDEYIVNYKFRLGQSCGCIRSRNDSEEVVKLGNLSARIGRKNRLISLIMEDLYEHVRKHGYTGSLKEAMDSLISPAWNTGCKDFVLMLNSDIIDEKHEFVKEALLSQRPNKYTDTLSIAVSHVILSGEYETTIEKSEIIPGLSEVLDIGLCSLVVPVFIAGRAEGFLFADFDADEFDYMTYYSVVMNCLQLLEMHRNIVRDK